MPDKIVDYEEVTSLDFSLAEESKARIKYNDIIKGYDDIIKKYDNGKIASLILNDHNRVIKKLDKQKNKLACFYGGRYWDEGVELEDRFNKNHDKLELNSCIKARKEIIRIFDLSWEYYQKDSTLAKGDKEVIHQHLLKSNEELAETGLQFF